MLSEDAFEMLSGVWFLAFQNGQGDKAIFAVN
jgi:hypothetical protein